MKERMKRWCALLLALVTVLSLLPTAVLAAGGEAAAQTYTKVTSADELATGQYVLVTDTGYAPDCLDGSWVLATQPSVSDDKIENPTTGVWTLTVSTDGVVMTDAKGTSIAPKGGNENGIQSGSYQWTASFANGKFTFAGTGEDTVMLASNKAQQNKFRAYKNTTASGYPHEFTLYKLETEPARESGIIAADKLQDGDKVVIFNPANSKALSTEYSGYYNKGTDVTLADGKLTGYTNADLWTVGITEAEDGTKGYTFSTSEGKKLSMGASYGSTPLDDVNTTWKISAAATSNCYYIQNAVRGNYLEWYADNGNWSSYGTIGSNEALFAQQFYLAVDDGGETPDPTPEPDPEPTPSALFKDGEQAVIYNPANMKALSAEYSGFYNKGTDVTLADGKLTGYTAADVWTVGVNTDGSYTFSTSGGKKLSMGANYGSTPLDDVNTAWNITTAETDGCYYIQNAVRGNYLEWYAEKDNWSSYSKISDEALFAQAFYRVTGEPTPPTPSGEGPEAGSRVVIYNQNAQAALAAQNDNTDSPAINKAVATIADGTLTSGNGAAVFTVEKSGDYYRFKNATYGYLCSNGTGNNAFYSETASDDADWTLTKAQGGVQGFNLESRTAKFQDRHSQYLEYYSDSFKTYSMYSKTGDLDYTIYAFSFYPVADGVNVTEGIVNAPRVVFGKDLAAYAGTAYTLTFTVDAPFGVAADKLTAKLGEDTLKVERAEDGSYTVTVPADKVTGESLSVVISGTDAKDVAFSGTETITVKDEPTISDVQPAQGSETKDDKRPTISAEIGNAGENASVTMTVNDANVAAAYENGRVTYTPAADLADGKVTVMVTVKRADGKEISKTWSFTVGEAAFRHYFGQFHSHTQYSDGAGSLDSALDYIAKLPESANVDFVSFTDHSNYFDSKSNPNEEAALYDASLVKDSDASHSWKTYKDTIADFNKKNNDVLAIGGFEMTWSGGPGHINTFNTPGIVSRNNSTLNNKTQDAGLKEYYKLLSDEQGKDSINQFNHPGTTFGNFVDFAYWDPVVDTRIQMVEVGNGEGQVGAGGYYPSYEQYIMALDKGWHVAPTNNQDNHKGKWGNANDARDVVLTDDFSEQGIYDAVRARHMYATEDKNLELDYTVNGQMMGAQITEVPEKLDFAIAFNDPDGSDSIARVELVVNSGKVAKTWDTKEELAKGSVSVELAPEYTYYFVRVTEGDGDIAVTAPVWVGESLKLGISNAVCGTSTPVTGEELTITTTLFNSEATEAKVKSLTYTVGGETIGTDTTGYTIAASSTQDVGFKYTPTKARVMTVKITAEVEQGGKEYTFTKDVTLDVQDAAKLVYIGIDASHYNEYVAGNYKDSMGNFGTLAAKYDVRTVALKTSVELIAACSNPKYKALILTAPSRRLAAAQSDPKTYSADELNAIKTFNGNGGMVILAGWSDNYENYDVIQKNESVKHMAATQNEVLAALGSSLRISDDATYDDVRSAADGVDKWRLYFSTYNMENPLVKGVEVDPDHPYDKLYTERFSHYGGASIYAVDASGKATSTLPATVSPVVYGHATTYSVDVDNDGLGGAGTPKYAYADGDNRLMVMASEQLDGKGQIIVSGAAFMSNFEVQATISDNGSEKNYSNYKICENLVSMLNQTEVSKIADVQKEADEGVKFTVEGVVTSNASGYDKNTAFFDCIYVQDETAGINAFPVAGEFKIGDKVRITGTTSSYQGERQLNVTTIEKTGDGTVPTPKEVTAAHVNDGSVLGSLVKIKGTITRVEKAEGKIQTIMVKDAAGNETRIFIDGYITTGKEVENAVVGYQVEAVGLASYDNTFVLSDGIPVYPRIRIRDRADIVCTKAGTSGGSHHSSDSGKDDQPSAELPFTDVRKTDWFYGDVEYVYKKGIMSGTSAKDFDPNSQLTRGMIVTVLYRLEKEPAVSGTSKFADVDSAKWYGDAVAWAAANGIVSGYNDTTFGPNDFITREQLAAILYRYAVHSGMTTVTLEENLSGFADADQISSYAVQAMNWAVSKGLLKGSDGLLMPKAQASRAQVAAILHRFLEG